MPRHLVSIVGKTVFKKGLRTDSRSEAEVKAWPYLREWNALIKEAQRKAKAAPVDSLTASAIEWHTNRRIIEAITPVSAADAASQAKHLAAVDELLTEKAQRIEHENGWAKAQDFIGVARGTRTPLTVHLEQWLRENGHKKRRTLGDYRRSVDSLVQYAEKSGRSPTIENYSVRRSAGEYASHLADNGMHARTANKYLSGLSAYWKWLIKKGHTSENPWRDQALPKSDTHQTDKRKRKRAFTDPELSRLLYVGKPDRLLREFMLIAALTGMRINEIAWVKVRDVDRKHLTIEIPTAKTEAGMRLVPIHSQLKSIILDRLKGKARDDWLFDELPEQNESHQTERYMPVSKHFGRYRQELGVHEKEEGQRQSRVDFHSFRRWFITKVQRTNMPRDVIKAIVGHKDGSVTFDIYAGGPSLKQFRAVVEAVRLPKSTKPTSDNG